MTIRLARRELIGLGLGCAASLAGVGHRVRPFATRRVGEVALWAADRAAHAVYGLDSDGLVRCRTTVAAPVRLRSLSGAACAVESATEGRSDGPRRWLRVSQSGPVEPLSEAPTDRDPRRCPRAILAAQEAPIQRVSHEFRSDGSRALWLLTCRSGDEARLERWVRRPGCEWERAFLFVLPSSARSLVAHSGGAWVVGDRVPFVRFTTSAGRMVFERTLTGVDGADDACRASTASGAGLWIAACGALVRLSRTGRRMPGQGGFGHLVALSPGPGSPRRPV